VRESAVTREAFAQPAPPAFVSSIQSPCISVCRMDARAGLCEGCLRTIDEIAHWSAMDDAQKRAVLAAIAQRRAAQTSGNSA
jgi:predicted Fe-S protein YdhL (DUF1289 family)